MFEDPYIKTIHRPQEFYRTGTAPSYNTNLLIIDINEIYSKDVTHNKVNCEDTNRKIVGPGGGGYTKQILHFLKSLWDGVSNSHMMGDKMKGTLLKNS